jgi:hypothetical protein
MPDLFLQPEHISIRAEGTFWVPLIYGACRADGLWEAWIEFRALTDEPVRATSRETTQPNRAAVEYWAGGLEPVYFEGAFARATMLPPEL